VASFHQLDDSDVRATARNDNWVQRYAARRNRTDSLDNNKSEQPACDEVIVALCATSRHPLRPIELPLSVTVLA